MSQFGLIENNKISMKGIRSLQLTKKLGNNLFTQQLLFSEKIQYL